MKKILVAFVMLISALSFSQEKVLLRLNYQKGDVYQVALKMNQDMGEMMKLDIQMVMEMKVTEVKEESFMTEASFKNVKMDMNAMGQQMKYDSNMKESEMDAFAQGAHSSMKDLLSTLIAFEYDKRGNVINTKVISGNGNVKDFQDNFSSMVLPEEEVTVGSTWSAMKSTKEGSKMDYVYEVTAINSDNVEVKVSGSISGEENAISGKGTINRETGNMKDMDMDLIIKVQGQKVNSKVLMTTTKK